jgi:hypothetical protein
VERLESQIILKVLGASKPEGLKMIAKIIDLEIAYIYNFVLGCFSI